MSTAGPPAETPSPGRPGGFRFPPSSRIRSAREIRALHARGKRKRTPHLDVFFAASPVSHSRYGAVVPKHGHRIVDRNRVRRRLREIGRTEVLPRLEGRGVCVDVLVRARRGAFEASFGELRDQLVAFVEDTWSAGC